MVVVTILVGFLIGTAVGMTGIGGAVMMLPLLILVLGVQPLTAVGSDAVFAALTKVGASIVHFRQKTVDLEMVVFLGIGSIPGALIGFRGLSVLEATYGPAIDDVLRSIIGVLLVTIPLFIMAQMRLLKAKETREWSTESEEPVRRFQTVIIGLIGGTLVGLTSVGSGSIILVGLLLTYHRPPAQLVGTDIVHAVVLTGLTGALHYTYFDTVDAGLVMWLLAGSVPGSLLGARLSTRVPGQYLQAGLLAMLLLTGIYLIST